MRLDVADAQAGIGRHRLQRADLIGDEVLHLGRLQMHRPAPEALQVGEAGVRPDAHTCRLRGEHETVHHARIPGVEAAGDVGRGDELEELGVVADLVGAEAFGHIAIDVDASRHLLPLARDGLVVTASLSEPYG